MNNVRALIVSRFGSIRLFAETYGYEYAALHRQIKEKRYTMNMIQRIVTDLNIEPAEVWHYFFE